ncbi:MAG: CPBP family intramembrane metalloprotease [Oscillospiraceae bacterium]|nr:CPBP family intramembrane metalloprotease [Oscillospiraceae bacterium]
MCSEMLSRVIPGTFLLTPWAMLLYALMLILWICRTGRAQTIGLRIPVPCSPRAWLNMLPLFLLPGYNLMTADGFAPDLPTAALMLCAAVTEEIFFRGFLLHFLARRSKTAGIYLTSILFSILHIVNLTQNIDPVYTWMQVICAFASGLCYSTVTISIGSLLPCIAAHFLTNITGSAAAPDPGWETNVLWSCIAACICWGTLHSYKIRKFDKEIQS